MIDKFNSCVKKKFSFLVNSKVVIAVSGGVDSMVLLDLINRVASDIIVAHVNYKLRGEHSDSDQQVVEEYCSANSIKCRTYICAAGKFDKEGVNLQDRAREIRYSFFKDVIDESGFDYICTAHHLDDNIETALMNLFRGTDTKGLAGINPIRNNIIRPLLSFSKQEIQDYALEAGIVYRNDHTNTESKYARNFIRNEVIPILDQKYENVRTRIAKTISNTSAQNNYVNQLTNHVVKQYLTYDGETTLLSKDIVDNYEMAPDIIYRWLTDHGFSKASIYDLLKPDTGVGKKALSDDYTFTNDRSHFVLCKSSALLPKVITIPKPIFDLEWTNRSRLTDTNTSRSTTERMHLEEDKLIFPLTIRTWQPGDKIAYQMNPRLHKKVKKIFVDNKLRIDQKHQTPVVVNGNGDLIWLVGLQKSIVYENQSSNYTICYIE